jgi:hypothetical protein
VSITISSDSASYFVKRATDILLFKNPQGTIIGMIVGAVAHEVIVALGPATNPILAALGNVDQLYYILLGIALFNLKQLFFPKKLSPTVEGAIELLEIARRKGDMPPEQLRIMYIKLYAKILDQVELDDTTRTESAKIADLISRSSDD